MPRQFELSFPPNDPRHEKLKKEDGPVNPPEVSKETFAASREEIAYGWRSDVRDAMYTKLIGQNPTSDLSEIQIADGILDPKTERQRVLRENIEEDHADATELYRRPKQGPTEE
jgi:hypothetical protein